MFRACALGWVGVVVWGSVVEAAAPRWYPQLTVRAAQLDPEAFEQEVAGQTSPGPITKNGVTDIIWTADSQPDWKGLPFGNDASPGPRHLRIGFREEVPVGAVLVRGGGQLSVLKSSAAYPGPLADDALWVAAERLNNNEVGAAEVAAGDYGLWVLPPGTRTRALRFTHTVEPTDRETFGWLGGLMVLPQRVANVAPQAVVAASALPEAAGKVVDGSHNNWATWENGPDGAARVISAEQPEWLILAWPQPRKLSGLAFLWNGFAAAEIEAFAGEANAPLAAAPATDWTRVAAPEGLVTWYPHALGPNWVEFGKPVETRAIRIRMTAGSSGRHPHVLGKVKDGRRVWLGEVMALSPLGEAPVESLRLAPPAETPPPIPIRFQLPEAGLVTLVIEDAQGNRVRNLVSEQPFPAGDNTAWWDGSDDLLRDVDAAKHGLYHIPTRLVSPGEYRVRGLWRKPLSLRYQMSVYSAGEPAWVTEDSTGCWLTNHTPPTSMAWIPAERTEVNAPLVMMGAFVSEGGHGLQWVREDGTKVGGQARVGGVWTGGPTLAVDLGEKANANHAAYVGSIWEGELRLTAKTRSLGDETVLTLQLGEDRRPKDLKPDERPEPLVGFDGGDRRYVLAGIAARDGLLVCSLVRQNELLLVDVAARKVLGRIPLRNPRGLAFDGEGKLLVLSERSLVRFDSLDQHEPAATPAPRPVIHKGLVDPRHVAISTRGKAGGAARQFYISDRGEQHVVKVFDAQGKPLRVVGKPGLPGEGPYDPRHMNEPNGLAVDSRGRLWVAEADFHPKRVSVWEADGRLAQAFHGPSEYGGGGVLDPQDRSRFYYKGLEFELDWQTGEDRLVRVFHRPDGLLSAHYGPYSPDWPLYPESQRGARYFTSCYTHNPTSGDATAFLWRDEPHHARLVAGVGSAHEWPILKTEPFLAAWPEGVNAGGERFRNPAVFAWSDANGDGLPQPAEVRMQKVEAGGVTVMNDLSVVFARWGEKAVKFVPRFAKGIPRYDLSAAEVLVEGAQRPASSGGGQALTRPDGWTILTNAPAPYSNYGLGGVLDGKPRWSYPSPWPGLHASHEAAVPDRPGMVVGHTRLLGGWIEPPGEGGPMFGVNGNMGNMYLLTADGLFVATLFHDIRSRPNWAMPRAVRNMDVSEVSLHDENFWPSLTQTKDGQVYVVDGGRTSLVRVEGLETIRRIPAQTIAVGKDDLQRASDWFAAEAARKNAAGLRTPVEVALRAAPPKVDGDLSDWAESARFAVIDRRGTRANFNSNSKPYDASAAVCVANGRLYAAFRTLEKDLLKNSGEEPDALFKTGGALDIMLATDAEADPTRRNAVAGDVRLLVTTVEGKPKAVLYAAVVAGTKTPVRFSSPWRTITLDSVQDVTDELEFAADGAGNFELSIPLETLGWEPQAGASYQGDLGVLRGNGFQTLQRVYWSNKATAITSDVPSEAELVPRLWGTWRVK